MNDELKLKYTEFEVNMIYGFVVRPFEKKEFSELKKKIPKKSNKRIRDGWVAHYSNNRKNNELVQLIDFNTKDVVSGQSSEDLIIIKKSTSFDEFNWPNARNELKGKIHKTITICKDGVGALTLSFKIENNSNYYTSADILRLMRTIPKTLYNDEAISIENESFNQSCPEDYKINDILVNIPENKWKSFSSPLKIFIKTLIEELPDCFPKWKVSFSQKINDIIEDSTSYENEPILVFEDYNFDTDAQIPYFYIFAKVPFGIYKEAFIDDNHCSSSGQINSVIEGLVDVDNLRSKYSKEVAAILGRWFNEKNIKFVSNEYQELEHLMSNGSFTNQYINSLIFTTYSDIVTFSMSPDLSNISNLSEEELQYLELKNPSFNEKRIHELNKPIVTTHQAILRCIEISRLRWHHAFWLNKILDELIYEVSRLTKSSEFFFYFEQLINIEKIVAIHFENPNSNLWDATVGSNLSNYLHSHMIKDIEDEIKSKLEITRNLINDSLRQINSKEFLSS